MRWWLHKKPNRGRTWDRFEHHNNNNNNKKGLPILQQNGSSHLFLLPNNVKTHLLVKKALLTGLIPWPIILRATLLLLWSRAIPTLCNKQNVENLSSENSHKAQNIISHLTYISCKP
jgi:hypothetical protein